MIDLSALSLQVSTLNFANFLMQYYQKEIQYQHNGYPDNINHYRIFSSHKAITIYYSSF